MKFNALALGIVARVGKRIAMQAVAPAAGVDVLIESAPLTPLSVSELPAMGFAGYALSSLLSRAVETWRQELQYAFVAR